MSNVADKLAELNATNKFSYGESASATEISVTVNNDQVEVTQSGQGKKKFNVRFPLEDVSKVLDCLRKVDKIANPRSNGNRNPQGETAAGEGAEGKKSRRRRRRPRNKKPKRDGDAEGDAKNAAESSAAIVLSEERKPKKERRPPRDPNAPDTRVPVDTKATIRNLNYRCTEDEFRSLLSERGIESKSVDWRVRGGKKGRFAGFCHVEFNTKAECDAAISSLEGLEFQTEGRKGASLSKPFLIAANYKEVVRE